jgi:four helix bundle protein
VPANIAEGHARQHRNKFRQYVHHSLGSIAELDTMRIIALALGYLQPDNGAKLESMLIEIQKMLNALVTSLS